MNTWQAKLCKAVYFAAWPVWYVYLRLGRERTRILFVRGRQILVCRNWLSDGKWGLPGGGLRIGEGIKQGAIREAHEETGMTLRASQLKFLCKGEYRAHGLSFDYQCFIATIPGRHPLKRRRSEIAELRWMNPKNLNELNAGPDVLQAVQVWQN